MTSVVHIYCSIAIVLLFVLVDTTVSALGQAADTHLLRILLDTSCHALIAGLIWAASTYPKAETASNMPMQLNAAYLLHVVRIGGEVLLSMLVGSAVDVDHFLAAGSASLQAATHLSSRPWGHAVLCCIIVTSAAWVVVCAVMKLQQRFSMCFQCGALTPAAAHRAALLTFSAYFAHLLRDSVRKGLWFCTLETSDSITSASGVESARYINFSTPPLPVWFVLVIYCALPMLNKYILARLTGPYVDTESKRLSEDELKSEV